MSTGRPTKLTPELQATIIGYIKEGSFIEDACVLSGLHKSTYYDWINRAKAELERVAVNPAKRKVRKEEVKFIRFTDATTRARAKAERNAMDVVIAAFKPQPIGEGMTPASVKAATWFLEHSFPAKYKHTSKVELEGAVEVSATVTIYSAPDNGRGPK